MAQPTPKPVVVGTAAELAAYRPSSGELTHESDTGVFKIGDGATLHAALAAQSSGTSVALVPADQTGFTADTETYDNPITGGPDKLTTMVFPASPAGGDQVALAIALAGDAHPRLVWFANPASGGVDMGDGTTDPWNDQSAGWSIHKNPDGSYEFGIIAAAGLTLGHPHPFLGKIIVAAGPLMLPDASNFGFPGGSIQTGMGAPACGGQVGDVYIQRDGADGSWIYRCTVEGASGVAVWAAKL